MSFLYENLFLLSWQQVTMWVIGGILIYLAIAKDMEPSLLLPIGFGAILVNMPFSGAVNQTINGIFQEGLYMRRVLPMNCFRYCYLSVSVQCVTLVRY